MAYELDFSTLTLGFLKKRLLEEDLIPSQIPLTRDLDEHIATLSSCGKGPTCSTCSPSKS